MTESKITLGQAIDQMIVALESIDVDARLTAIEAVCTHLKISGPKRSAQNEPLSGPASGEIPETKTKAPPTGGAGGSPPTDIRTLKAMKNPKSAREMACIVAFYLQELAPETERKESISASDLEKYFKQAQFKLPEKIGQVLPDAKGSGYFDSASRGAYKLNAVGYNLVAHKLPVGQAAS